MQPPRWRILPADPGRAEALARAVGIHPLTAQLLLHRGVTDRAEAERFLHPRLAGVGDPYRVPDMARAVRRIRQAIARGEPILLFSDSDTDGLTAGAILYETLRELGAVVRARQSNRVASGYGIPAPLVRALVRSAVRLVILVDCGTNQRDAVEELSAHGIDTVIIDHHVPLDRRAEPAALLNPQCGSGAGRPQTASFGTPVAHPAFGGVPGLGRELCSAGLAFQLAHALFEGRQPQRLAGFADLAALGTLADCSPLIGENRQLVAEGLARIVESVRPGLRRLCAATGTTRPDTEQIVTRLLPRLNASGRLGDARMMWRLLLAQGDPDDVEDCLAATEAAHTTLKQWHRRIIGEAHEEVSRLHFRDAHVLVVSRTGWHQGLMGPLASQLAERYSRPTIAIAVEGRRGIGSGRSVASVDLLGLLQQCREFLVQFGGHAHACGLTVEATELGRFRERVNLHAARQWPRERWGPEATWDLELPLSRLQPTWVAEWDRLAPFGRGNPRPSVVVRGVVVECASPRRGWVRDGSRRVALHGNLPEPAPGRTYDVAGSPSVVDGDVVFTLMDARVSGPPVGYAPSAGMPCRPGSA